MIEGCPSIFYFYKSPFFVIFKVVSLHDGKNNTILEQWSAAGYTVTNESQIWGFDQVYGSRHLIG